jgi:hypothetical protein
VFGSEHESWSRRLARSTTQRYGSSSAPDKSAGAAAALFREIRDRVPLCDDLVDEIARRHNSGARAKPPRGRRVERPE